MSLSEVIAKKDRYLRELPPLAGPLQAPSGPPLGGEIARWIDHTLLKPEATRPQVRLICQEALEYGFASVCVNPGFVPLVAETLAGSPVEVCTVIGFPLGASLTAAKAAETGLAIEAGATEVDMVLNIGALKGQAYDQALADIQAVVRVAREQNVLVKVILETALLTREEKIMACLLCQEAGADFVKTSTGFSSGGATCEDVTLMRRVVGPQMGVKASGGIRTYADAVAMIRAGANRLGASAGVAIVKEALDRHDWNSRKQQEPS